MAQRAHRLVATLLLAASSVAYAQLDYLGQQIVPTGAAYAGTTIGGLSGIDYDAGSGRYYAISDDRSAAARFYTLTLDLARFNRSATPGSAGVTFTGVTTLLDTGNGAFAANTLDPEAIRFNPATAALVWASEGDVGAGIDPFVREMNADGTYVRGFSLPAKFRTGTAGRGVRNNLAFESVTFSADRSRVYAATENALQQDGPPARLGVPTAARVLALDYSTGNPLGEYVYVTDPVAAPATIPGGLETNGLVELLAVSDTAFIAVERSFSLGAGNAIKLYVASLTGATDVAGFDSLPARYTPMTKTLLLDLATLTNDDGSRLALDNIEGATFGPALANGNRTLILVSDNNFNPLQFTQFLAFEITQPIPEPSTVALLGAGVLFLAAAALRQPR